MPERDLPALWGSAEWLVGLEAWLVPALANHGVRATAPVVRDRVRFWSVVARVETDAGRVWVKENAPSQAFEAGLVALVDHVLPGVVAPLLAVETERGWLASADLGLPMWHDETPPPLEDWVAVMSGYAGAQRSLAAHEDEVIAAGVARFPEDPDEVVGWVAQVLGTMRALPGTTRAGRPTRRCASSRTASAASTTPRLSWRRADCPRRCSTTTSTSATPSGVPTVEWPTSTSVTLCGRTP